ncbi:MAG: hypothetical protein FWD65_01770 [Coriobacteriia bacterium]|nr:hypothetical protein [Coriobacteriia bacterium]
MSFFKKETLSVPAIKKHLFDSGITIRKDNWYEVFSASLGKVMANQQTCSDLVVRGQDWNVDFTEGVITFGKEAFPLQFIGSESASSNSWLWGWENINHFPEEVTELSKQTKRTGEQMSLDALTTAEFELSDVFNGHSMSVVTCALSNRNYCYYRGPHSNGAIFCAFSNLPDEVFTPVDMYKFVSISMDCIQQFSIDHHIFVQSFLYQNDTPYELSGQSIIAHFKQDLRIEFEQAGEFQRICSMKSV